MRDEASDPALDAGWLLIRDIVMNRLEPGTRLGRPDNFHVLLIPRDAKNSLVVCTRRAYTSYRPFSMSWRTWRVYTGYSRVRRIGHSTWCKGHRMHMNYL